MIMPPDGQIFKGHVAYYTSELDDPDGVASLSIELDGVLISFTEADITKIETAAANTPTMAEAI